MNKNRGTKTVSKRLPLAGAAMGAIAAALFAGFWGGLPETATAQEGTMAAVTAAPATVPTGTGGTVTPSTNLVDQLTALQQEIAFRQRLLELRNVQLDLLKVEADIGQYEGERKTSSGSSGAMYSGLNEWGGDSEMGGMGDVAPFPPPMGGEYGGDFLPEAPMPDSSQLAAIPEMPAPAPVEAAPVSAPAPAPRPAGPAPVVAQLKGVGSNLEAVILVAGGGSYNVHQGETVAGWKFVEMTGDAVWAAPADNPDAKVQLAFDKDPPSAGGGGGSSMAMPPSINGFNNYQALMPPLP
jgi:type IV pilus biogenesis protein PilP